MRTEARNTLVGLAMAAAVLLFSACQSATPQTRIQENPALYESLPHADQALVAQGRIRNGMSPQAVYLAWGAPNSQPYVGQTGKKRVERWVYTTLQPVTVMNNWPHPYWGRYGWYDAMGPDTAYIPRTTATVTFENEKVVSWEALRP